MFRRLGALVAVAALVAPVAAHGVARAQGTCTRGPQPYAGIPGAAMTATEYVSKDIPPLPYIRWRGTVPGFDGLLDQVAKIVGVSDDYELVERCEADAQAEFGARATATRSQPYYLDVTSNEANKGWVVERLSRFLDIPTERIATIGDQLNDVLMFKRSGFSIAMGNADDDVKAQATVVTDSYKNEGFAKAMERFILDRPGLAAQ